MSKKLVKKLSKRFSYDDWVTLCGSSEFLAAIEAANEEQAMALAWGILTPKL